jgi:aerobic C4-dicarboxylate transport protein
MATATEIDAKAQHTTPSKKRWYTSLYAQVIIAITIGILLGHFYPSIGVEMKPLGDGFIKLIKMIIGPIIFCTIVHGIAGMDNLKQVGRVGLKALGYFMFMTTFALIIGLVVVKLYEPGVGMNIDPATLDTKSVEQFTAGAKQQEGMVDFIINIIPTTISSAFASGNILQILFISILSAVVLAGMGEKGKPLVKLIEQASHVLFGIVNIIMKVAPLGAFGAMAFTIGQYGVDSLASLAKLMIGFYVTCFLFVFIVLGVVMKLTGLSLWKFLKYIREEIFIVIGTSSSESVLPRMIEKMNKLGCEKSVAGMVIPTGYSFNLDGTAIYLTMAALFIAQATNTEVTLAEELGLLAILLLTSKGAAGVTGSGFIVLAATLATVGHIPVAGIALILGIDRFMSEARAVTNLIGNGVATLFVAKWEKALDMDQARKELG